VTGPIVPDSALIKAALAARKNAYAPYSHFTVGAALLGENGKIYRGCNVECASYSGTNCAERTALFSAVADGCRRFAAIAVVGAPQDLGEPEEPCPPCGVCRQLLREFCNPETFRILLLHRSGIQEYHLAELLPHSFGPEFLG
jgi:cytidine deaminase